MEREAVPMPFATTGDILTHYEDESPEPPLARRETPVVLIHGHSADLRLWEPQAPALLGAGWRVVRYDVRGHGRSSVPATGYSWEHYLADLRALLDHLRVERAHLAGISMGGAIALQLALEEPGRVASLTLLDSALPGFAYSPEFEGDVERLREAVRAEGSRAALERHWLTHPMFDGVRRRPEAFAALRRMVLDYPAADYLDEAEYAQTGGRLAAPPERSAIERLQEVQAPALVVVGERDLPDFRIIADILAENLPRARKLVVPDAGHLPSLERPEEVNPALLSFLAAIEG
jgi:pimeloyl-ACP methyl ester carboxylesterase